MFPSSLQASSLEEAQAEHAKAQITNAYRRQLLETVPLFRRQPDSVPLLPCAATAIDTMYQPE